MSDATTQRTPADVRELAVEIIRSLDLIARNYDSYEYGLPVMTHYDEMVDTVVALLRTPRGEGERGLIMRAMVEAFPWSPDIRRGHFERAADAVIAALRSEAQGEDDVGEACHLCGEEFDPRESGTVTGPLGQDDGVPRWYRCPRCARAYDAGYQQGQRDPRGDHAAHPTDRSESDE